MTNGTSSTHEVNEHIPSGFNGIELIMLMLQYEFKGQDDYHFSYKLESAPVNDPMDLVESIKSLERRLEGIQWSRFMSREELVIDLDIEIKADTIVVVETVPDDVGRKIIWSPTKDAIMTLEDRSGFYGHLRYWNPQLGEWQKRADMGLVECRRINFKAKHNAGGPANEAHKFSYNVKLKDRTGALVEYEIDPDVRNPSV